MEIQSILNCANDISIFILSSKYEYIAFNEAHKREIYRDHGRFPRIGENIFDFLRPKYKETFEKILKGESFSEVDEGDSQDFWASSWGPYYESGEIKGIVCFAQEITEKIHYQNELEENRTLLDAILECSPDISVFALDKNYKLIAFNSTFVKSIEEMHHKTPDIDMSMIEITIPEEREKAKKSFDEVLSGKHVRYISEWQEYEKQKWIDNMSPIYSKKTNQIIGLCCFGTKV